MKTLTADEIRARLRDRNFAKVARACGLSTDTLYRLRAGVGTPTHATLVVLTTYLTGGTNGQT
jgi:DNA-binding phage protein